MTVLQSRLKTSSEEFKAAAARMRDLVDELNARLAEARKGGEARARKKHQGRGKLLPRERVAALLDPGAPFRHRTGSGAMSRLTTDDCRLAWVP